MGLAALERALRGRAHPPKALELVLLVLLTLGACLGLHPCQLMEEGLARLHLLFVRSSLDSIRPLLRALGFRGNIGDRFRRRLLLLCLDACCVRCPTRAMAQHFFGGPRR